MKRSSLSSTALKEATSAKNRGRAAEPKKIITTLTLSPDSLERAKRAAVARPGNRVSISAVVDDLLQKHLPPAV